jgi:ubiquinone/menaquinone biosynthesis C-methylase UbiE
MENFQPVSNIAPNTPINKIKFYGRMLLDLQILSIYRNLKKILPVFKGKVLDIGCGGSPYKHLLQADHTKYYGIDIAGASQFKYNNSEVTIFDGKKIPFEDNTFDAFLCTEVLEHCPDYRELISEMYRVSKKDATGIITVPWSARFHYIPYDYFRYTPSTLKDLFSSFSQVTITPRGTDITAISSKIIVLFYRNLFNQKNLIYILLSVIFSPVLVLVVLLGHLSLLLNIGSSDDPIGYTILVKK